MLLLICEYERKNRDIYMEINISQFRINMHLPRTQQIEFTNLNRQLDDILNIYQQYIDNNAHWYPIYKTAKGKPKALIYSSEGFTEYGLKKLSHACKQIDTKGNFLFHFADSQKLSDCNLMCYIGCKALDGSQASRSSIKFSFKLPESIQTIDKIASFITGLAKKFSHNFITMDITNFPASIYLFPPRINLSLMAYIPSPLQHQDYPEVYQLIPIIKENNHVGTVIVLLNHFPNIQNINDIKTMYSVELKLREADLLPMNKDL